MLEPLAVDPKRSVAPAANSMASARLVFPAPAGPTSAITRVPFVDSPVLLAMRDSPSSDSPARESLFTTALGRHLEAPPSACFCGFARGVLAYPPRFISEHGCLGRGFLRHERSQGTSGKFAGRDACARLEGHPEAHVQARMGRQCRARRRRRRFLRLLRAAFAARPHRAGLRFRR